MTALAIASGRHGVAPPAAAAVSKEAREVEKDLTELLESFLVTSTYVEPREEVLRELGAVAEECRVRNWDGYDARPVSERAIDRAWNLLDQLVDDFPAPGVAADPDGEVSLDWHDGADRALSISVNAEGRLAYAGLFGRSKTHGVEYLQDEVPEAIVGVLRRFSR